MLKTIKKKTQQSKAKKPIKTKSCDKDAFYKLLDLACKPVKKNPKG